MQKTSRGKDARGSAQQFFDFADVTFTNAQVNALFGSPLAVVPAPGPSWAVILEYIVAFYQFGAAAFTIGTATGLGFKYTNAAGLQVAQVAITGFIDQGTNQLRSIGSYRQASAAGGITPVPNAAIVASMLTADVTVGTGCLLKLRSYFRRVPATL